MSSSSSSSSSAGGKRTIYSSSSSSLSMVAATLMIILLVLQIWVCCDCRVGAIRIFSAPAEKQQTATNNNKSYKEGDLVRKYFGGSAFNFSRTAKGIADDKRRVPSCPDPLHN